MNHETGELLKSHKHGALFFDSLKSYSQVSEIVSQNLNGPAKVEIIHSPRGMYDYFIHQDNPEKILYDINDIETGCGFELDKFLFEQNTDKFINEVVDIVENEDFTEFEDLVRYARQENYMLLNLIIDKTIFFSRFLDSRRHNPRRQLESLKKLSALRAGTQTDNSIHKSVGKSMPTDDSILPEKEKGEQLD